MPAKGEETPRLFYIKSNTGATYLFSRFNTTQNSGEAFGCGGLSLCWAVCRMTGFC
jgi:hypothetical protein